MGLLAPSPRHLLKKVDENFQTWVCANIGCLMVKRTVFENKKIPHASISLKMGVWGKKAFFLKKVSSPAKKYLNNNYYFISASS